MLSKAAIMGSLESYLTNFGFELISLESMWEMFVIGFVKAELSSKASLINTNRVAKGFGKFIGNKGSC